MNKKEVCKKLKEMASDESKAAKEYHKLRDGVETDANAWNVIDDIYQDEAHHRPQLIMLMEHLGCS